MRRKHLDILARRLLRGDLRWLASQALKRVSVPLSHRLRRVIGPPVLGGLVVTYRCDASCPMCSLTSQADEQRELSTQDLLELARQFADAGVSGISITGGEPMLREDVPDAIRLLKERNLPVSVSTNGMLLADKALARRLLNSGVDSVAVSLDAAVPAGHDASRGRKGAFDRAVQGLENLLSLRQEHPKGARAAITVATVASPSTLSGLEGILSMAKELGADNVSVNPVHDTASSHFGPRGGAASGEDISRLLLDLKRRWPLLDSSEAYLRLLSHFFNGCELPMPCLAPYFSLYADCYGRKLPCGGHYYQARTIPGLDRVPLDKAWRSQQFQASRDSLRDCRACFFSCMAELNLTYVKPKT